MFFYIKESTWAGELKFPSSEGKVIDWYDILLWGETVPGEGAFFVQGAVTTQLNLTTGTASNPVALTTGTGTDSDEVESGASVDLSVKVIVPAAVSARRLYFDVGLLYLESA